MKIHLKPMVASTPHSGMVNSASVAPQTVAIQHGGARDAQRAGGGQREGVTTVEPTGQPAADTISTSRIAAQHHQRRHLDLVALFAHALEVGRFGDLARMNQPTSSSTTLARNGMRQPQDSMSSSAQ